MNNKNIFIGIVASRDFKDYKKLKKAIDQYVLSQNLKGRGMFIVSGGGSIRPDPLAARYSEARRLTIIWHKPDRKKFGKSAGIERNRLIIEDSDVVFACWKNNSKGSKHAIDLCKKIKSMLKL